MTIAKNSQMQCHTLKGREPTPQTHPCIDLPPWIVPLEWLFRISGVFCLRLCIITINYIFVHLFTTKVEKSSITAETRKKQQYVLHGL